MKLMNESVKSDLRQKIQVLKNKTSKKDFSVLLNYCLYACTLLYGYAAFASFLRLFGDFSGRSKIMRVLHNIRSSSNDVLEFNCYAIGITISLLIVWHYFLNKKLMEQGVQHKYSLNATIWSWFIPVVNLVFPFKILCSTKNSLNNNSVQRDSYYLLGWIVFWLGNILLFFARYYFKNKDMHWLTILASLLLVFAYNRLRKMVKDIAVRSTAVIG